MSEWVESYVTIPRNRKFARLRRELGLSVLETLGLLHALWYYVVEQSPGGFLDADHSSADIADGCYYEGDPDGLIRSLVACGWLDRHPDGLEIHDWQDYNRQHRERCKAAARQAAKRERDRLARNGDVTVTDEDAAPVDNSENPHGERANPDSHSDVTVTSRTTERQRDRETERQRDTRAQEKGSQTVDNLTSYPDVWAISLEKAGQPKPTIRQVDRFVAEMGMLETIDPDVMHDTIARMVERGKGPPLLRNIYADVKAESEREIFAMQVGGGKRVR